MGELPFVGFLGLRLARCTTGEFVDWVAARAKERSKPCLISYLNAANVNLAFESAEARRLFARMDCLYADGKGVVWASRWLGQAVPERINAGDFTEEFFARCASEGLRVGLVGGRPGVAESFARHFQGRVPGLEIVLERHGYLSEGGAMEEVLEEIERRDPDVAMIGMGSPLQERLAAAGAERGRARAWWCVGGLFEYGAGARARAPVWMRRAGLEWAFRLGLEPRRLGRRYLLGNPAFVYRTLRGSPVPGAAGPEDGAAESDISGSSAVRRDW